MKELKELKEIFAEEINRTIKVLGEKYELKEVRRGRPRKEKVKEKKKKGARGRPAQEEKKRTSNVGEDLIERLIREARVNNPLGKEI
jgi:hypothetical protein